MQFMRSHEIRVYIFTVSGAAISLQCIRVSETGVRESFHLFDPTFIQTLTIEIISVMRELSVFANEKTNPNRLQVKKNLPERFGQCYIGDPYEIRTRVTAVKGRCLNHLTNGPLVAEVGLEPTTYRV